MPILWVDAHHQTICNPMPLSDRAMRAIRRSELIHLAQMLGVGLVALGCFCAAVFGIIKLAGWIHRLFEIMGVA